MTKFKCDNCGKKYDRMHIIMECRDCYVAGIFKQLKEEFSKEIKKRMEFKVTKKGNRLC